MKVLLIGSGGREHALAWALKKNPKVTLTSAPGSSALASLGDIKPVAVDDIKGLTQLANVLRPDLTVIGPELPLTLGLADALRGMGLAVFGPSARAARLEGSKFFAKDFMVRHNLPTANYALFYDSKDALNYLNDASYPVVIKADGLASGKGVVVCGKHEAATKAIEDLFELKTGQGVLIEEFLAGEEISFLVVTDGKSILPLPPSQDHKPIFDGDRGPNTGGMGAYSPTPLVGTELEKLILETIVTPTVNGLAAEGATFCGLLYFGLMITMSGPKILEFNARFGDPETQTLMPRLKGDLASVLKAAAVGRLERAFLDWDNRSSVCVVMSAKGYPGAYRTGDPIGGLEEVKKLPEVIVFEAGVDRPTQGPNLGQPVVSGGRVLGVTALGDDISQAIKNAYQAVSMITWPGAHFRSDIAAKALRHTLLYPSSPDDDSLI
jgi:phosphoribosylamine--glycine ligase